MSGSRAHAPRPRPRLGRPLPRAFYARTAPVVARDLLGRVLVFDGPGGRAAGRIVECEAYRGADDPASHAHRGVTPRTAVMFGPPGHAYVYVSYGMHHCLNLVTEPAGRAGAVLVRALEPLAGLALMRARRGAAPDLGLARGPGCLARALGISRAHDGLDLTRGPLWVADGPPEADGRRIARTARIGIRVGLDRAWRFVLAGHPAVSGPRRADGALRAARRTRGSAGARVLR